MNRRIKVGPLWALAATSLGFINILEAAWLFIRKKLKVSIRLSFSCILNVVHEGVNERTWFEILKANPPNFHSREALRNVLPFQLLSNIQLTYITIHIQIIRCLLLLQ